MQLFNKQARILGSLLPYLWPKDIAVKRRFILGITLLLLSIAINISIPPLLSQVVNTLSHPYTAGYFAEVLLLYYGCCWMFGRVTDQFRLFVMAAVIERGTRALCMHIFEHLLKLSHSYHTGRKTGAVMSALERAQVSFPPLFWGLFFSIIPTIGEIIIAMTIIFIFYGAMYGAILFGLLLLYLFFNVQINRRTQPILQMANEKYSAANSKILDSLMNFETIHYFGNQKLERARCDQLLKEREHALISRHQINGLMMIGQGIILGCGIIFLTWLSGTQVLAGTLNIGDFILINGYLLQLIAPLNQFGIILKTINDNLINFEEVLTLLAKKPEIKESPHAKNLHTHKGRILFDQVSFHYDERPILQSVSFEIAPKKTIAIVGPTGSGKSTIAKLLFRFYAPTSGKIIIDDEDISQLTLASLHNHIGIVPQQAALFHDTLLYNISYGNPEASASQINEAIAIASLDTFISNLPQGLETPVGERGLKLSGGEIQRVAIARMLLKKPSIIIFDEATSSLDAKTERQIQKNIFAISREATTIVIAHRLSTVIHADEILVLDQGKLIENGNHSTLLRNDGLYAHLWSKQMTTT